MNIDDLVIRPIREKEYQVLDDFLYEAIFVPAGVEKPPKDIINKPELQVYVKNFGKSKDDYGHIDNQTPSMAISLCARYRGHGLGEELTNALLKNLKVKGYKRVSLSVQKENHHAIKMYQKVGFKTIHEDSEEYLMICDL